MEEAEEKEQAEADRNGNSKEDEEPQPECDRRVCFSNDPIFKEALVELEKMGAKDADEIRSRARMTAKAPNLAGFSLTIEQLLSMPAQSLAAKIEVSA